MSRYGGVVVGLLMLIIGVAEAQMPSVYPSQYGMDRDQVLEAVQVSFIEQTFTKPFMESQKLFETEEDEVDLNNTAKFVLPELCIPW